MRTEDLINELIYNVNHQHDGCGSYNSRPFFEGRDKETLFVPGVPYIWSDANAYANPSEGEEYGDGEVLARFLENATIGFKILRDDYYGSKLHGFETYEKVSQDEWRYTFEPFEG